jgi:hypothetical protein
MKLPFRALLIAIALLSSGALQVAAASGEDECCPEEESVPCPDLPQGVACVCCPSCIAVRSEAPDVAPTASPVRAVAVAAAEPRLDGAMSEIFLPPRG